MAEGVKVKMPKSPKEALIEYEKQCAETGRSAEKAMRNCINNGAFLHFEEWKASRERMKLSDKDLQ